MSTKKNKERPHKNRLSHPPLKPKQPHTEGAPDDKDPDAQYEDKDES